MNTDKRKTQATIPAMVAIFGLVFTLYLFTFNGQFTSIDELALYARAESVVQQGNFETPQIEFATYHNQVGDSEPGYAIAAAPLYWLARQVGRLNNIHVLMLLNPFLTATTAAVLYATAIQLGYSRRAGLVAALTFGLATLAWPYARTFYREPLVAFGWMLALYGLVRWRYGGKRPFAILALVLIGLMVLVKATAVVGVFIFLAGLARNRDRKQLVRYTVALLLLFFMALALFQAVYWLRYGRIWGVGNVASWTVVLGLRRIYGQLFSPGKGLLFYMPVILLTIPGLWLLWRRHRAVTLAVSLPLLTMVVAYSTYGAWYGGQSWGARFLLPALPLLLLTIAPLWDGAARWRLVIAGVIGFGVVWQLPVQVTNWWAAYVPLYESGGVAENEAGLTAVSLSPPLMQW
ncbi:MAG: phospholipid carrier-dependent glycosyltransferase, partial [Aquificales bacterium]|nr:phospholipid carrier-dependent glycosyltransferase [Aquificales bacterium]